MMINEFYGPSSYDHILNAFVQNEAGFYQTSRPLTEHEIITAAKLLIANHFTHKTHINNTCLAQEFLIPHFAKYDYEVFTALFLNNKNEVVACEDLFKGTLNKAHVYVREVVRCALKHNASSIILAHNHPSGYPEPSQADIELTQELEKALSLIEIKVLDHIIVGSDKTISFMERGLL